MGTKYAVDENVFINLRPDSAYVLGYLFADGNLESSTVRGKYFRFSSVDIQLVEMIRKILLSQHTIRTEIPKTAKRKTRYIVRIGSAKIYDSLLKAGLTPRKSLTMKFPKISYVNLPHFIRGYFDGDGCVHIEKNKMTNKTKRLSIVFTSGSYVFLSTLSKKIAKLCRVTEKSVYKSKRSFQLKYSSKDSVKIYNFMYKDSCPCLERKFELFRIYLQGHVVK